MVSPIVFHCNFEIIPHLQFPLQTPAPYCYDLRAIFWDSRPPSRVSSPSSTPWWPFFASFSHEWSFRPRLHLIFLLLWRRQILNFLITLLRGRAAECLRLQFFFSRIILPISFPCCFFFPPGQNPPSSRKAALSISDYVSLTPRFF